MTDAVREKTNAAAYAVALVQDGMRVGLGTGSTAEIAVRLLGDRVRAGLDVVGVPTSERTRVQAQSLGIKLSDLERTPQLDIVIDGADEADAKLRLVKGGGGALLREKVVASVAKRVVVICDSTKLVATLGAFPLPVEVATFAWPVVAARLRALGGEPTLRADKAGAPFVTDEGHFILDARFGAIADPERLARDLSDTPGVMEHGLFIGLATDLVVGRGDGVETY
jgi:ribose 5-phosphate isomerase A